MAALRSLVILRVLNQPTASASASYDLQSESHESGKKRLFGRLGRDGNTIGARSL